MVTAAGGKALWATASATKLFQRTAVWKTEENSAGVKVPARRHSGQVDSTSAASSPTPASSATSIASSRRPEKSACISVETSKAG
jgi:hypothetical protein